MSNCEKNASNDAAPALRQQRGAAAASSALHAMPDDSPQLIRIQENVSVSIGPTNFLRGVTYGPHLNFPRSSSLFSCRWGAVKVLILKASKLERIGLFKGDEDDSANSTIKNLDALKERMNTHLSSFPPSSPHTHFCSSPTPARWAFSALL